jgi:hypothetical protein
MLQFVIGSSGQFAEWCSAVVAQFADRVLGRGAVIHANTLEEISRSMLQNNLSHGVARAHHPGGRLGRALVEAGRPFIVALDDPRSVLADLLIRHGVGMATAIQRVASSCASAISFSETPGALVLDAERDGRDPVSTAAAIARHLQFDVSDVEIADIVGSLGGGPNFLDPSELAVWWESLDSGERAIASGALGPYLDHSPSCTLGPITWEPELFFAGEQPGVRATAESTSPAARAVCIIWGPRSFPRPTGRYP